MSAAVVTYQTPAFVAIVNGIPTPVETFTTRHGVDQPIGSASLTVPVDGDVSHIDLNADIEIKAGYADSTTERVFLGRIVDIDRTLDITGTTMRVQAEDWATLLNFETEADATFAGSTRLADVFRAYATTRGVPLWEASHVYYPTAATHVAFGGVSAIDNGDVVIRRRTRPLAWISQKLDLFGYRVFGSPDGTVRVQRVSGLPSASAAATFTEGVDIFRAGHSRSTRPMVTNWTVYGARYTDDDGVSIELRSIPASVPEEPYLTPPGYRSGDVSDPMLVTQALVDAARNAHEIDYSEAYELTTWETYGRPEVQPGQVITITSASVGIETARDLWVMSVDHQFSDRGFTTRLTAWAGAGSALPAGIDETIISIGSGVYRMGDEYLPHYVTPSGGGNEQVSVAFTVPGTYTSLALTGRQHGTNSYLLGGVNTEASVSKLEVWQGGERVGTADLPMSPENLTAAYDYTNDAYWTDFRMPIPGKLTPGAAELRIISGRDNRISDVYALDDFEVKNLAIEARGTGSAVLPEVS